MKKILLLALLMFFVNIAYAYEASIEYDEIILNYFSLDKNEWNKQGIKLLIEANKTTNTKKRIEKLGQAAGAYQTLTKIDSSNAENMATLGHIYGKMGLRNYAISFLDRGLNLSLKNPIVNNYYAIFSYDEREYRKALKYFINAEQYGYPNLYEVYYNIGVCYGKLGELNQAYNFYQKAYSIKNSNALKLKIRKLEELKYSNQ